MNWSTCFLIYLLNIRSGKSPLKVKKIFLLENNFWCANQEQFKTDKGYLYRVDIDVESKSCSTFDCVYYSETCYYLKSTDKRYVVLKTAVIESIISFLESSEDDKFFLKFGFLFIDKQIESPRYFESFKVKMQKYVTYKLIEKKSEDNVKLKNDEISVLMEQIKDRFGSFISMNPLRFNEYIKKIDKKKLSKIETHVNFNLHYFKNHLVCLENLKKIIKDLCHFNLVEDKSFNLPIPESSKSIEAPLYVNLLEVDNVSDSFFAKLSKVSFDKTTTLKVSEFRKRFWENFFVNLKKMYDIETDKTMEVLFDKCFICLKQVILNNKIFFPIGDKYDTNYYVEELFNLSFELALKKRREYVIANLENKHYVSSIMINSLRINLKNLQERIVKDLCKSEYIPKHFSKILEKEVKTLDDYVNVDKIVCDFLNMFVFIFNLYHGFNEYSHVSYSYCSPIYFDNYNLKIVDGIKIEIDSMAKFRKVIGFDVKGKKHILMKDTDYFINEFNVLYCPYDVLKKKNIQEIEVISSDFKKNYEKIKVNEYLRAQRTIL